MPSCRPAPRPTTASASPAASARCATAACSSTCTTPRARSRSSATRTICRPEELALVRLLDIGDLIGVEGLVRRTPRGELTVNATRGDDARQGAAAAAGEVPRPRRYRAALPPALPRPDHEPAEPRDPAPAQPRHRGDARLPRRARLSRSRDADAAHDRRAAPRRSRSSRITTRSTWTFICASRRSCI